MQAGQPQGVVLSLACPSPEGQEEDVLPGTQRGGEPLERGRDGAVMRNVAV